LLQFLIYCSNPLLPKCTLNGGFSVFCQLSLRFQLASKINHTLYAVEHSMSLKYFMMMYFSGRESTESDSGGGKISWHYAGAQCKTHNRNKGNGWRW
jgi:hypothetical protein